MKHRIKYSGCVHVRGIFRRTWRPRHIEIDQEGIVRYFCSNSKERLDRALQIFSLPDFKANDNQTVCEVDNEFQEVNYEESVHCQQSLEGLPHHIHDHRPKAVMTIARARLLDESSIRDMHIGLPQGTYGFVFTGRQIVHSALGDDNVENDDESNHLTSSFRNGDQEHFSISRDYLCSVASLEEAKQWVQILNWASKVAGELSCNTKEFEIQGQSSNNLVLDEDEHDFVDDAITANLTASKHKGSSKSISYIIVSKVPGFKLGIKNWTRLIGIDCEIYYEIKLLLLDSTQLKLRERKRQEYNQSGWEIREFTIYRSLTEIQCLIEELKISGYNTDIVKSSLDGSKPTTFQETGESKVQRFIGNDQVSIVSRVIRGITSDVSMCNSIEAKRFFALFSSQMDPRLTENKYFLPLIGNNVLPHETTNEVQVSKSIDDFVTEWLTISKESKSTSTDSFYIRLAWMLKNGYFELVGTVAILYLMKEALFILSKCTQMSFQIRVDIFSVIIFGSFYEGYRRGISRKNSNTDNQSEYDKQCIHSDFVPVHNKGCFIKQEVGIDEVGESSDKEKCSNAETLSSPLPSHPANHSYWSQPDDSIFKVRGATYLNDRVKRPSKPSPFKCRGVDMWLTDNPERNIARLSCVLGGKLDEEETFLVNFLLPFGNFVTYFTVDRAKLSNSAAKVWNKFVDGDQQYRDARLKLLPIVINGPWIVKRAVGPGSSPALLGQSIPLQYYFTPSTKTKKGVYEVDVIITASRIAKGILSVVKGHTKHLTIALGFIIEGTNEEELPETVLASCQIHSLHLERCMKLPTYWDDSSEGEDDEIVY